jgi:hypothetical protein
VLSNPGSGHNRDRFAALRARIDTTPGILAHRITEAPQQIDGVLREFAALGIATLAINGGDGTVSAVLGQLLESRHFARLPQIAILPAGTANMTAGDVGLRGSLGRAVRTLCAWAGGQRAAGTGPAVRRRMLRVQRAGDVRPHYGMFLGAGAVIHGTEYAHREIHSRGLRDDFSLALGTARTVWGVVRGDPRFARSARLTWQRDEQPEQTHDALILALSTLHRLAFGMRPFWGKGPGPLRMTLLEQHCRYFLPNFTAIVSGHPMRMASAAHGYHSHNLQRLRFSLDGPINLDGEILNSHGPFTVEPSPALDFLRL